MLVSCRFVVVVINRQSVPMYLARYVQYRLNETVDNGLTGIKITITNYTYTGMLIVT